MPSQLKMFNVIVFLILTGIFTNFYYNFYASIIFALFTSVALYILGGSYLSLIFIVLYSIYLVQIINKKNSIAGVTIEQTDIDKTEDNKAFLCDKIQKPITNIVSYKKFRDEMDNRNFSLNLFLYINGTNPVYKNNFYNYRFNDWKSIFYLGNNDIKSNTDIENLKQVPGLWLKPSLNNIVLNINDGVNKGRLELNDVPLNTWFSISIVVNNSSVSLFKNCKLEKILSLKELLSSTSEYNLYIANDGKNVVYNDKERNGFSGQMAYFKYYNFTINQNIITDYCKKYKLKLDKYQNNENKDIKYTTSCLITDSDKKNL